MILLHLFILSSVLLKIKFKKKKKRQMFQSRCRLYFVIIKSQKLVRNVIAIKIKLAQWLSLLHNFIQPNLNSDSNPARGVSENRDGEDLWQWSQLEIKLNAFRRSTIPKKQFRKVITFM